MQLEHILKIDGVNSENGDPPAISLEDIPKNMDLFVDGTTYIYSLLGCILHQTQTDEACLGHHTAAVRRVDGSWESYNDLLPDSKEHLANKHKQKVEAVCYVRINEIRHTEETTLDPESSLVRNFLHDLEIPEGSLDPNSTLAREILEGLDESH